MAKARSVERRRHKAFSGSLSARTETISVSVTPEVKAALLAAVQERKNGGHPGWSINREAWERIRESFGAVLAKNRIEEWQNAYIEGIE